MEIIGKYGIWLVWKCESGCYHKGWLHSSGCLCCKHSKFSTYFDYLDVNKLQLINNSEVIKELENE